MGSLKTDEEFSFEDASDEPILYVNGLRRVLPDGLAHLTLLQYLRGSFPDTAILIWIYFHLLSHANHSFQGSFVDSLFVMIVL